MDPLDVSSPYGVVSGCFTLNGTFQKVPETGSLYQSSKSQPPEAFRSPFSYFSYPARALHAWVRFTLAPLDAFCSGAFRQAATRGLSTNSARSERSFSHIACRVGIVNLGLPSPSVPATRSAIISLPRRVRRPCSTSIGPMIGEKALNGWLGFASQYESLEFST